MLAAGIRVARGPDWIWHEQDDGEGHVGTLCEIGRSGSTHSPDKTVVVNWDSGHRTNYRVGYHKQYDLIVIDNAQIGVKHPNVVCDGCNKAGIAGIRFRCAECQYYDLCATCYGNDVHDLDHPFIRFQTANSVGIRLPPRKGTPKIQLKGIFVGARVIRGPDWEWNNQDGGPGKTGRVLEIRGWDNESCRSVASVAWASGSTNVYRLGHKGNVDLRYVQPSVGGFYYKDHMPVLGQPEEQQPVSPPVRSHFYVGDRVQVAISEERLKTLQQGHGGWNPRMAEYLSKVGIVHRITDKGDIRVQYEGCSNRWTFHPAALVKIFSFNVGDIVTFIADAAVMQQLQKGHGEWIETMQNVLGKMGKVIKIYGDGDLRVQQLDDDMAWTVNPKCVKLSTAAHAAATERSNSMRDLSNQRINEHHMAPLAGLGGHTAADRLVREAALGNLEFVQTFLNINPEAVDCVSGGKTCLQVAAHQGHVELVKYLLLVGANVNVTDKEGDTTLHYAAFGNQPEIMRVLLQNKAKIDELNSSHCTALHISAHKKPPHCVKVLLEFGANVNVQDAYGDTALHDAIGKENIEVVEMLCGSPTLDLTIRNHRGFNALHHASLKGNVHAARHVIRLARQLVNVRKDDGFSALHLAALNGHTRIIEVLVQEGQADINIRNNRSQTPFLLAVSQGHTASIEKLVDLGCDVRARDEDGDNAMHLCIIKKANLVQDISPTDAPKIHDIYQSLGGIVIEHRLMYALLCFLASEGCPLDVNRKGARVLDWIGSPQIKEIIVEYERTRLAREAAAAAAPNGPVISTSFPVNSSAATSSRNLPNPEEETQIPQQLLCNFESMSIAAPGLEPVGSGTVEKLADAAGSASLALENGLAGASGLQHPAPPGPSNPPTPARRNRGHGVRDANAAGALVTPPAVLGAGGHSDEADPNLLLHPSSSTSSATANVSPSSAASNGNTVFVDSPARYKSPNRALSPAMGEPLLLPPPAAAPTPPPHGSPSPSSLTSGGPSVGPSSKHISRRQFVMDKGALPPAPPPSSSSSSSTNPASCSASPTPPATGAPPPVPPPLPPISVNLQHHLQHALPPTEAPRECIVCNETLQLIVFDPCHHQIACEDCGLRMKKCLTCGMHIERRTTAAGWPLLGPKDGRHPSADRLRYLESKIMEIEETHCCSICMERRRNLAFLCGHGSCSKCGETLKICHMCRKPITKKINLY
ncbi:E3 ubiquitin-protein ligase MIB2 [Anopheles stephensi]|uniref:E3 ubiquitin-protein ligase MIB2 n=1 Tax=Anopheles stephensi TaxID=30069 RepID=UPI0016587D7B|nr:E3 ubiquitin-protein ligase MIB2 [Anopheles stephensi]XP_035915377.1 E3 ubiquitin-protein ligase MIB2 [Anopheles stephensi]XP_035915378.1 E3 ubiquitin-protein ligase MIB2 [Anopheles stephensi]XP_035915380.1 E3 ubiquitin-protein ligase MIB2 [Anopheles stephensi]XP_035915381.1 E3 ubiquitin-protein ligase MIB2 [Anopheles stephensi]